MNIKSGDIILVDTHNDPVLGQHRNTKFGVAVVINEKESKYLCINTENRQHYSCFPIYKTNHDFLLNDVHYICCSKTFFVDKNNIIKKRGELNKQETRDLIKHIKTTKRFTQEEEDEICNELAKTLI